MDDPIRVLVAEYRRADTPEKQVALAQTLSRLPKASLEALQREFRREQLAIQSREFTPEGYAAFFELVDAEGNPPPDYLMDEIRGIFTAHAEGRPYSLNGWRGSWKSVSISAKFVAWMIGIDPALTHLIIGAADPKAGDIAKNICSMIENNPNYRKAFPHVEPDRGRWSSLGYWVRDTRFSPEEWAKKQASVIDPTFVAGGYQSTQVNGKHPTGCLVVDDIHDLNNSTSERERKMVVRAMTTVILKTVVRKDDKPVTWFINVGVPWAKDDSHAVLRNSGAVAQTVPAMRRAPEGVGTFIDGRNPNTGAIYEDIIGWWILTDPRRFGVHSILSERALGKVDFWQMIMMDLDTASAGSLKYYLYPHDEIGYNLPTLGGVDPTNVEKVKDEFAKRSSFAMGYACKLPRGGAVVKGGVLKPCGLVEAVQEMATAQAMFPNWQGTFCEDVGGGAVVIQAVRALNPKVRIAGSNLRDINGKTGKVKSKKDRILYELAPWLENGIIKISDEDTPYLNALRKGFDNFYELDEHDESWDAMDSLYHIAKAMPDILVIPRQEDELPTIFREKKASPLAGIGAHRGY